MRVAIILTLSLGLAQAYAPTFIKSTDHTLNKTMEFQIGIKNLLQPYCDRNKNCLVIAHFAADVCSTPSNNGVACQSDCEFLLLHLWDRVLNRKPDLKELQQFVPDCCVPYFREKPRIDEVKPTSELESKGQNEFNYLIDDKGQKYGVFHVGFHNDWDDDIQEGVFHWKIVDQSKSEIFCQIDEDDPSNETNLLKPGEVLIKDCREEHGYLTGEVWGICLNTGFLLKTLSNCRTTSKAIINYAKRQASDEAKTIEQPITDPLQAFKMGSKTLRVMKNYMVNDSLDVGEYLNYDTTFVNILTEIAYAVQHVAYRLNNTDPKYNDIIAAFKLFENEVGAVENETYNHPNVFLNDFFDKDIVLKWKLLTAMEESFRKYAHNTSAIKLSEMKADCHAVDNVDFLTEIGMNFLMADARIIASLSKYDVTWFDNQMGKIIIIQAIRSALCTMQCVGLNPARTWEEMTHDSAYLRITVKSIFDFVMKDDTYIRNHAMNHCVEKDVIDFYESHGGDDNVQMVEDMYDIWSKKYHFFDFATSVHDYVSVYGDLARGWKCFKCIGLETSGYYFHDFNHSPLGSPSSIEIMYGNKPSPTISKDQVQQMYEKDSKILQNFAFSLVENTSVSNVIVIKDGYNFACSILTGKGGKQLYQFDGINVYFTD